MNRNIDVLAVLDAECAKYARGKGVALKSARTAISELVEASAAVVEYGTDSPEYTRLIAALAVFGGEK